MWGSEEPNGQFTKWKAITKILRPCHGQKWKDRGANGYVLVRTLNREQERTSYRKRLLESACDGNRPILTEKLQECGSQKAKTTN